MEMEHGSGSSKHLGEQEGEEGSASTNPFDSYPKLRVPVESRDHSEKNPEKVEGSPNPSSTASSESGGRHVMIVDESRSSSDSAHLPVSAGEGDDHIIIPSVKLESPSSSSSSSSSSASSEDLFVVDTKPDSGPVLPIDSPGTNPPDNDNAASSSTNPFEKEDGFPGSILLSSTAPDAKHEPEPEPLIPLASPTKSPPVQVMDRTDGYDPFRIPSSIFETSPSATPQEWSVASNESLFSIHVGNNSFSREHAFMWGEFKSGELFSLSPQPPFAVPSPGYKSPVHIIEPTSNQSSQPEKVVLVSPIKEVNETETMRKPANEEETHRDASLKVSSRKSSGKHSKHSHSGSGDSVKSFAFPIKKKKCSWASCIGSNCSWAFWRHCTCPRCYFRWPSCHFSCCSWAFCYSWNCSRKGWYCCSSCNLTDRVRSGSDKTSEEQEHHRVNVEEENLQPPSTPDTPAPPKKGYRSWFSCFPSCCSWKCPYRLHRCCC